ncbi:MAG: hybrid sensor histidine kinase/response regulator [Sandaracinus sp.]|nr:hybrid sensor histidine kinase/response regulator [Sandaracinus sp.]MCB9621345.1 hybrid sensor histidine kinase/response regulator [Sandaracinus sp.]MCB9632445.1 hybrid sensor histidine kinase/response regulator [Sandaracinus sp.]
MYRVMVVDDEAEVRDALVDELSGEFEVEAYESAAQALHRLDERHFDALVSDVRMPTTSGLTLLQRAVQVDPDLVRIFLTGYSDEEVRDAALELGAFKLRKPWGDELALLLHHALAQREQWTRLRAELDDWTHMGEVDDPRVGEEEIVERVASTLRRHRAVASVSYRRHRGDPDRWRVACSPVDDARGAVDVYLLGAFVLEVLRGREYDAHAERFVDSIVRRAGEVVQLRALTTEVRDRTRELDRVRDELMQRERFAVLGAISMGVVHDVRSPLSVLVTNHEDLESMLRESGVLDAEFREMWEENGTAIETIRRILTSMERVAVRPNDSEVVDVDQCLSLTARLMRHRVYHAAATLELPPPTGLRAHATTGELCQIAINLIANALDHSPRGGRVMLELSRDAETVFVRVRDEGPGIGDQDPSGLFEPFRTTSSGGLGIGLTVARSMARRHGGDLVVLPQSSPGACFELRLRIVEEES